MSSEEAKDNKMSSSCTPDAKLRMLVNNEKFSDVIFEVGQDGIRIYAHSLTLSLASPVFERMFHGDMLESNLKRNEPIKVPDLTTIGFINMLKYCYGFKIDEFLKLHEIHETYKVADKYIIDDLKKQISDYINQQLNLDNCLLIYDQLIKFQSDDILPINKVKKMIKVNSKKVFESEYFAKICESTLINILSMNYLIIDEIDALKSCARWVEEEVSRLELEPTLANKQKIFEPIKNLIKFKDLSLQEMNGFIQIKNLLNADDLLKLFLFLIGESNNFETKCETQRKKAQSFQLVPSTIEDRKANFHKFNALLTVDKVVFIKKIETIIESCPEFKILRDNQPYESNFKIEKSGIFWHIEFPNPIELVPGIDYELEFINDDLLSYYREYSKFQIKIGEETINFNFFEKSLLNLWDHEIRKEISNFTISRIDFIYFV